MALRRIEIDGPVELARLLDAEDTDGDKRITVSDESDEAFELEGRDGRRYAIEGTYALSNLLQEISLALDAGGPVIEVDARRIWEPPTRRIARSIRELYWDALTRRIDGDHLGAILADEKVASGSSRHFLFVPSDDPTALRYFCSVATERPDLQLQVEELPAAITPEWVRSLDPERGAVGGATPDPCDRAIPSSRLPARHGLLVLGLRDHPGGGKAGVPFVVPGGRFNEMYGWDSYFEALGLLVDGRVDLARAMVDNFVYQIRHYGKILNANRTYYLTRSQPPFLTSMISAVYRDLPQEAARLEWLRTSILAAIREYEEVWMGDARLTETGLSRYFGSGRGAPPEVEPGHFAAVFARFAAAAGADVGEIERSYRTGELASAELDRYFVHDRCMRESGHDTTYRWDRGDGNRCADFVTVDLNSLLHKAEVDIARIVRDQFADRLVREDGTVETSAKWYERARRRRAAMLRYLWDESRGMFFDYDLETGSRFPYVSATTLYPLWAWNRDDPASRLLSDQRARRLVASALPLLEAPGGVAASSLESRGGVSERRPQRQWDYPHGWAPHQMLVWQGLRNYDLEEVADRLTYAWLYAITINAVRYNGTVPEKLDVVRRSHRVFAEYGNVGTDFDYITREGFGWMNASYQVGLAALPAPLRSMLDRLVPPEWIDFSATRRESTRGEGEPTE